MCNLPYYLNPVSYLLYDHLYSSKKPHLNRTYGWLGKSGERFVMSVTRNVSNDVMSVTAYQLSSLGAWLHLYFS